MSRVTVEVMLADHFERLMALYMLKLMAIIKEIAMVRLLKDLKERPMALYLLVPMATVKELTMVKLH